MSQQQKPQQVWIFTFFHVYDLFQLDKCVGGSQATSKTFLGNWTFSLPQGDLNIFALYIAIEDKHASK